VLLYDKRLLQELDTVCEKRPVSSDT